MDQQTEYYQSLIRMAQELKGSDEEICGMDAVLSSDQRRIASLDDLSGFFRISADTLVHKADKDLWAVKTSPKGGFVIERLFDADTKEPLRV
jgi:hypothetical protein